MTNGKLRITAYLKDTEMATDFSGGEDEFFEDIHSPTDNSEDSVDVKVSAISLKNKRKCSEPRRVEEKFTGPLKKRMCLKVKSEKLIENQPFRPWSPKSLETNDKICDDLKLNFAIPKISIVPPYPFRTNLDVLPNVQSSYFRPPSPIKFEPENEEPVSLVKRITKTENVEIKKEIDCNIPCSSTSIGTGSTVLEVPPRVPPLHTHVTSMSTSETQRLILQTNEAFPVLQKGTDNSAFRREQRNYKNMTRERRIEANARERTRVHTISAAFDTLRKSIPSYSHNQKLSKLSVLRIACSYIMTLSNIVEDDPKETAECIDLITKTIQKEGKLRKKKDDND